MSNTVNRLKVKDFITIGVFFVIYFVVLFAVGMIGIVPILFLVYPFTAALVLGTVVMLFMAKVGKPWALFILGMLTPTIMFAMGHTYIVPLISLIFIGFAEFIFRKGQFKSFKHNAFAYATFSCWSATSIMQILLVKDRYVALMQKTGMQPDYIAKMEELVSVPVMALVVVGAFIGGLIGALIGKVMLKKHFEKAGIV
ncbi:MAG: hypothetical protein CR988_01030 [Treponema sp.]|nr:MAG: hypothetical protein CR988_01030 [Treponema sp.]